ncbi:MAG: imidazole glycerol phosphate synthase subunit HisF [Verrucomicrobia bacterium]|nr:imidazole glycerol phosphate synthase subunit HisF [Verrucomicrobiota bacterium]
MRPRIIPVLLLKGEGLVKGTRFKDHKYVGDPINAVRIFNDKNADELFLLDITATQEGRVPSVEMVRRIAEESYMPFGVGGGIRSVAQMRDLLRAGAEKVAINSAAVEMPDLIREGSNNFGRQSITVSIDVKRNWRGQDAVWTHSGARKTGLDVCDWARRAQDLGAGEILLNSIDRDGTGAGYDLPLVRSVADAVEIPVIACGGAGKYEDFLPAVREAHASAVAAGSLFVFHGPLRAVLINYPGDGLWDKLVQQKEMA